MRFTAAVQVNCEMYKSSVSVGDLVQFIHPKHLFFPLRKRAKAADFRTAGGGTRGGRRANERGYDEMMGRELGWVKPRDTC